MNKELKEICSKCEDYIHCQGKGCAFRSLGNEYCDEVENVNKLINDLQQENKQLKDNWNELKKYLEENLYFYSGYQGEDREEDISIKYVIDKIKELEEGVK